MPKFKQPPEGCPLTPVEWEVILERFKGWSHKRIARERAVSPSTVRQHLMAVRRKTGVDTKQGTETILSRMFLMGWVDDKGRPSVPESSVPEVEPLSPVLKLYLEAFDRLLLNWRNEKVYDRARKEMRYLLGAELITQGREVMPNLNRGPRQSQRRVSLARGIPSDVLP